MRRNIVIVLLFYNPIVKRQKDEPWFLSLFVIEPVDTNGITEKCVCGCQAGYSYGSQSQHVSVIHVIKALCPHAFYYRMVAMVARAEMRLMQPVWYS